MGVRQVAGIIIPDSKLAVEATEVSRRSSPEFLFNHCLRTFVFGAKAGQKLSIKYDPQLFYVIAIPHDLGLTEDFEGDERFEVVGADSIVANIPGSRWG